MTPCLKVYRYQFFGKVCCLLLQVGQILASKKSLDYPTDEGGSNKSKTLNRGATSFSENVVCTYTYILRGFIYHRKIIFIVNVADTCYLQPHIIQLDSQVSRSCLILKN